MTPPGSNLPRRYSTPGFHRLTKTAAHWVVKCLMRLDVQGLEHIPPHGAIVGVMNHLSAFDPLVMLAVIPVRPVTLFAAIEHRQDFIFGWALDRLGAIWIHRGEPSREALRLALNELAHGTTFGIAPEGTRSKTGALLEGKTGAAYLATRANAPIVPAVLWGTEQVKHNLRRFRRTLVHVRVSSPFRLPEGRADAEKLREYTELIMHRMAALLPPKYRGVYTDLT
ncbi:MAG TPA: lysophospholipid acyltransferase family protein [Anaerolineae bacterium]|nr:lysophospholipid acyltransferase family protein [Anaerolineae bacterium]